MGRRRVATETHDEPPRTRIPVGSAEAGEGRHENHLTRRIHLCGFGFDVLGRSDDPEPVP